MKRYLFILSLISLVTLLANSIPAPSQGQAQNPVCLPADFFCDDFNETGLDVTKWDTSTITSGPRFTNQWVSPPSGTSYGSVGVAGSEVIVSNTTPTISFPIFPFFWSKVNPFPMAGDFELTIRMKYDSLEFWGPGIQLFEAPGPFTTPTPGSTTPDPFAGVRVAFIHGDPCGLRTHLFNSDSCIGLIDRSTHTYTLRYQSGQYTLFKDGVLQEGPLASTVVPNFMWIGNPVVGCCGLSGRTWSSFRIDFIKVSPLTTLVPIDIKPDGFPNAVNPNARGIIPVAILTTTTFDATTVDPLTVQFGPAGALEAHNMGHIEDVDGDGDLDLVLHFMTRDTEIACSNTQATLTGQTFAGQSISGADSIVTVHCP